MASATCNKCGKTMEDTNFYTYKSGNKTELCKKCLTMHIDNFDPTTFLWLLEKMDVPYIPEEWNVLRNKAFEKDPHKMNGMSVFGKYLSKMRLKMWKDYSWADSERLQQINEEKAKAQADIKQKYEQELKASYSEGKISESEYKTLMSVETQNQMTPMFGATPTGLPQNFYNEDNFISEEELTDPSQELTQEDKVYLAMKWGRLYKPSEWLDLERKYDEMMNSFDIQDSDTIGTLILICKTYLKMNQAIDCGDMEGYQKLSRVYDSLRKSAKFTAAQNKEEKGNCVDSIGELVAICEKEGFIPRYATDIPQDKVDKTLQDMNGYLYKLVTQDLGFGQQIEDSLKKIQLQKELNAMEENYEVTDEDVSDYYEEIEEQRLQDEEAY